MHARCSLLLQADGPDSIPKCGDSLKLLPSHTGGEVEDGAKPADSGPYMTPSQLEAASTTALQQKNGNNAVSANDETSTLIGPLSASDSGYGEPDE